MILDILNNLYLLVWAILLIHCLQSNSFYPIFVNRLGTKIFWIFTFAFFNPVLSLLYILCFYYPNFLEWKKKQFTKKGEIHIIPNINRRNKIATALVFTITCIVLILLEIPRKNNNEQQVTVLNKTEGSSIDENTFLKSGLNIGFINSKNKIQTISSNQAKDNTQVRFNDITLICKSDNQFLELIASNIQKSLAKLPYVNSVSYYKNNKLSKSDVEQSDFYITLDMPELTEDRFLLNRTMQVKVNCDASSSIYDIFPDPNDKLNSESIEPFTIQSQLQHTSKSLCIECPGTEYKHEVENITQELSKAIKNQFENLMNKNREYSKLLPNN